MHSLDSPMSPCANRVWTVVHTQSYRINRVEGLSGTSTCWVTACYRCELVADTRPWWMKPSELAL
jgi:hypothetical protein